jgi:steroid delta-isomerase-like uncharacterized protein
MTAQENEALVRSQLDVYNSHHTDPGWFEKKIAVLHADFEITDMPSGRTYRGANGFMQNSRFYTEAFPDHQVEITNVVATEDQVVVEFTGRGTHTGPLHLPAGDIPPTGRQGELRCCNVYQIKDGKIASLHSYYDAATLLRQLGLAPATT